MGVAVTLTNQDTGIVSRVATNGSGAFVFLNVDPGPYTLTFAKPGFRTISIQPFTLTVNQTLTENQTMTVGLRRRRSKWMRVSSALCCRRARQSWGLRFKRRRFTTAAEWEELHFPADSFAGCDSCVYGAGLGHQYDRCRYYGDSGTASTRCRLWAAEPADVLLDGWDCEHGSSRGDLWVSADHRCDE